MTKKKTTINRELDFDLDIKVPELESIRKELVQINKNLENLNKLIKSLV